MKIAYFDTIAGISGDMTIGAFLSAGVPIDVLKSELGKIALTGYEISQHSVEKNGIFATKFDVKVTVAETKHRHLSDIKQLIESSRLSDRIKKISIKIFEELARAEAIVHNTSIEKVHFHEVGAIDSIIDIVGTAICINYLEIEKIFTTPVKLGSGGFVQTQHGNLPIPTPAVVELLKDYPVELTNIEFELTTPTGAAIIRALSSGVLQNEEFKINSIGYGAGNFQLPIPNLLRIIIGDLDYKVSYEELILVETNIDDMNPEIYPYVVEKLISMGAHDAYLIPIIMKKGRPGILLSTLISKSLLDQISNFLFKETTTLGLRIIEVDRKKIYRELKLIDTKFGKVQVKVVDINGQVRYIPEFEECRRIASETGMPLIEIYKQIEKEFKG